jgi:hypothetical protein
MVTTFFGVTGFESACGGRFRCLTMTLRWLWKRPSYSSKRKSASVSAEPLTISVRAVSSITYRGCQIYTTGEEEQDRGRAVRRLDNYLHM